MFIVIQLQLSAFSSHPSTPPQTNSFSFSSYHHFTRNKVRVKLKPFLYRRFSWPFLFFCVFFFLWRIHLISSTVPCHCSLLIIPGQTEKKPSGSRMAGVESQGKKVLQEVNCWLSSALKYNTLSSLLSCFDLTHCWTGTRCPPTVCLSSQLSLSSRCLPPEPYFLPKKQLSSGPVDGRPPT